MDEVERIKADLELENQAEDTEYDQQARCPFWNRVKLICRILVWKSDLKYFETRKLSFFKYIETRKLFVLKYFETRKQSVWSTLNQGKQPVLKYFEIRKQSVWSTLNQESSLFWSTLK